MIAGAQGLGFAVPARSVKAFLRRYTQGGNGTRSWLGVSGVAQHLENGDVGVLAIEVVPGSPAARGGLQPMDVILGIDGAAVTSPEQLVRQVEEMPVGARIVIEVQRGNLKQNVYVVTSAYPMNRN
jgi:S1-C subfamily serine protease